MCCKAQTYMGTTITAMKSAKKLLGLYPELKTVLA